MKLYVNRSPITTQPWGDGSAFVTAFLRRVQLVPGVELLTNPALEFNPDVVLAVGLDSDGYCGISIDQMIMHQMYFAPNMKIVLRVNENDARKGTKNVDAKLLKVSEYLSGTVFVSHWLQKYFADKGWKCANQTVIHNGVAGDVFKPQPKLNNGKLNIVTHHWSDNPMKGADIYEALDQFVGQHPDKFTFTYVGRTQSRFRHSAMVRPLVGQQLAEELGKYDVYVSGSRFDPAPDHVLEAISCGLPTFVHQDGGGAREFAGEDHIFQDFAHLVGILTSEWSPLSRPNQTFVPTGWQPCVENYVNFLNTMV
jgi:glycosyltransferase involved in cell wall biosynthesis